MTTDLTSRNDLPFVTTDRDGERHDWRPLRIESDPSELLRLGLADVGALAALARVDEHEAWRATMAALLSPEWNGEAGEEAGFADALARAAIVGWRAMAHAGELPFSASFDPAAAQWRSLHTRVELMEAQLQKMDCKPWRTAREAGWE